MWAMPTSSRPHSRLAEALSRSRLLLPLGLWASLLLTVGCISGCNPAPEETGRGIILLSIDTLGADHLGLYGYDRPTSPFLDSLSKRGVVFENAYVQLPGTLPSHMSMFTGLYPEEHGVFPPAGVLSPEIPTLPEILTDAGFRTAGHTEGGYVLGSFGFSRGFDEFSHEARRKEDDVERTLARGLSFLKTVQGGEDFFLFLHTYVVHDPYRPEERYLEPFWTGPKPETPAPTGAEMMKINRGEVSISQEGIDYYRALYDASIAYMDETLAGFVAAAEGLDLSQETTLIITSDHGEEFMQHGQLTHVQAYPETMKVPLIFAPIGSGSHLTPRRINTPAESVDLATTILEMAGIPTPHPNSGESLVGFLEGDRDANDPGEAFGTQFTYPFRILVSKEDNGLWFYREQRPREEQEASQQQLFDLLQDQEAAFDLAPTRPDILDPLTRRIGSYDRSPVAAPYTPLTFDKDLEDRLRAMGYIE